MNDEIQFGEIEEASPQKTLRPDRNKHFAVAPYGTPAEVYQPDVLSQLYGGQLATWQDGKQVMVFVDDHHCEDC